MIDTLDSSEWERLRAIRLRALADAPDAFASTFADVSEWPDEQWQAQMRELHTLVMADDGRDLGMVRGVQSSDDPDDAFLISMWVDPVARGRGVGHSLVGALVAWARETGFARVILDVGVANAAARRLYEACGFRPTGTGWRLPPPREHIKEMGMELLLR